MKKFEDALLYFNKEFRVISLLLHLLTVSIICFLVFRTYKNYWQIKVTTNETLTNREIFIKQEQKKDSILKMSLDSIYLKNYKNEINRRRPKGSGFTE